MRSSERLPLPEGWRAASPMLILPAVCAPVFVLLLLPTALPTLGTADWATGTAALAAGVLALTGAYAVTRTRMAPPGIRAFGLDETAGTTQIRYSRATVVLRIVGLASAAVTFGSSGALVLADGIGPFGVSLLGIGLMFAVWLVVWCVRGVRVGELTLGPERIALRVNSRVHSTTWDEVHSIRTWDAARRGPVWRRIDLGARRVSGWHEPGQYELWFDPRPVVPNIEIRCDLIDVDAVLLHCWLRFYLDNPAARSELGTPASLARAEAADFSH